MVSYTENGGLDCVQVAKSQWLCYGVVYLLCCWASVPSLQSMQAHIHTTVLSLPKKKFALFHSFHKVLDHLNLDIGILHIINGTEVATGTRRYYSMRTEGK